MLYREALLELGEVAQRYVSELSRRKRDRLREKVLGLYALLQAYGASALQAAMSAAEDAHAYGAEYLSALLCRPKPRLTSERGPLSLVLNGVPDQAEVDRQLSLYEAYAHREPVAAGAER
jgi:hypothetical protein